ncbi:hypothetical protein HHI36_003676 [Cryptolaemus montrouzieri]|uniref:Uncharacterized protein n=1 Tax=Cryptolaemus montrouzieri TaxID=559131 RepID=A0ABD2PED0_9CUCU
MSSFRNILVCAFVLFHVVSYNTLEIGLGGGIGGGASGKIGGEFESGVLGNIESMGKGAEHVIGNLEDIAGSASGKIGGEFESEALGNIKSFEKGAGHLIGNIEGKAEKAIGGAEKEVGHIEHGIEKAEKNIGSKIEGVVDGIEGAASKVGDKVENVVGDIEGAAKGVVGGLEDLIEQGINKHEKESSKKEHQKKEEGHEKDKDEKESSERSEEDSIEHGEHKHKKESSEEKHHKKDKKHHKKGKQHHEEHDNKHKHWKQMSTGQGIDRKSGIGSFDGIRTPIYDLFGVLQNLCTVSYAAEDMIEKVGDLQLFASEQIALIDRSVINYVTDNIVMKVVNGVRKYHIAVVGFLIDSHVAWDRLVVNVLIEGYRMTKAPVRELFACQ